MFLGCKYWLLREERAVVFFRLSAHRTSLLNALRAAPVTSLIGVAACYCAAVQARIAACPALYPQHATSCMTLIYYKGT